MPLERTVEVSTAKYRADTKDHRSFTTKNITPTNTHTTIAAEVSSTRLRGRNRSVFIFA